VGGKSPTVIFRIEVEQEESGGWLAEGLDLAGAMTYGATRVDAVACAKALALRVVAERLEHGETSPGLDGIGFRAS